MNNYDDASIGEYPTNLGTIDDMFELSQIISASPLCPPHFGNNPHNVFVCLKMGKELDVNIMESLKIPPGALMESIKIGALKK